MDFQTIKTYNRRAQEYDEETIDFWDRFPRTIIDEFVRRTKEQAELIGLYRRQG